MRAHCSVIVLAIVVLAAGPVPGANAAPAPASCWPALDRAGEELAGGQLAAAAESFGKVSEDGAAPPFVRALAMLGLAETALARNDVSAAVAALRQLAGDSSLPHLHRDIAARRIVELERVGKGLPPRDPDDYRVKLPAIPEPGAVLHVAPSDARAGDGSEARPFNSLEQARDAVRAMRKSRGGTLPPGGVRIILDGGAYPVRDTLKLDAQDSGTADAPIVYQAKAGQTPLFTGGIRIPSWRAVSDAAMREKLDPAVRQRVLEADLKALGVKDLGDATTLRQRPELFCDGVPQTLARWPNEGFVQTGPILGTDTFKVWNTIPGCRDGKFEYVEDRPARWLDEPDVRLYGYWFWDWYEEYQKVASIDPATRSFTLAPPYSNYGYRKDQRYHAVNVFRELDRPGEWYLDRRSSMIYWLPPEGLDAGKSVTTLSVLAKPFIALQDVRHVMVIGLSFEDARGDGIHIRGGADCLVAGCTLRQLGGDAIVIAGGQHHGIFGCTMATLGCGGARVAGGDRQTLSPGQHFVENCTVFDISRLKRTYTPAVHLDGCGNRVAHNRFERMPSSAMRIEGNDHLIELNAVSRVVQESDDQGGIDMYGNPLYRGVVIRWNRWSDIRGGTHCGAAGIRLDDMISGIALYGNLFERCGEALFGGVQIHGGKDNLVDGNVFMDCHAAVSFSRWGQKRWLESIQKFTSQGGVPPYSTRYPDLARLNVDADVNCISRSVVAGSPAVYLRDGNIQRSALVAVLPKSIDLDVLSDQKRIDREPQLRRLLFEAIPLPEIGPYAHPWCAAATGAAR